MNIGRCKGCGQPIVWIVTTKGKKMPCDPQPVTGYGDHTTVKKDKIVTGTGMVLSCNLKPDGGAVLASAMFRIGRPARRLRTSRRRKSNDACIGDPLDSGRDVYRSGHYNACCELDDWRKLSMERDCPVLDDPVVHQVGVWLAMTIRSGRTETRLPCGRKHGRGRPPRSLRQPGVPPSGD